MVSFEDFAKLDLRVGKITAVEDHPNADKLYCLKVDIGQKQINLVAGIKSYYKPEELLNKLIVVVVNLEPKSIRGVTSEGMLLAAQDKDRIVVIGPEKEVSCGSKIS